MVFVDLKLVITFCFSRWTNEYCQGELSPSLAAGDGDTDAGGLERESWAEDEAQSRSNKKIGANFVGFGRQEVVANDQVSKSTQAGYKEQDMVGTRMG